MSSYSINAKNAPDTLINLGNVTKITYSKKELDVCYASNNSFGFFVLGSGSVDAKNCDKFKWDTEEEAQTHFRNIKSLMTRK